MLICIGRYLPCRYHIKQSALTMEERTPAKDLPNIPPSGPLGSTSNLHDSTKTLTGKRGGYAQMPDLKKAEYLSRQRKKARTTMTVNLSEPPSSLMGSMDPNPFKDAPNILTNGI